MISGALSGKWRVKLGASISAVHYVVITNCECTLRNPWKAENPSFLVLGYESLFLEKKIIQKNAA